MPSIKPKASIIESGQMIRIFTKDNMNAFWAALKPLLPYILGLHAFDLIVNLIFRDLEGGFGLGSLIAAYFYACFAINWHRVVLHGAARAKPMNPFKPEKTDLAFIGMGIALFFGLIILSILSGIFITLGVIGFILFAMSIIGLTIAFAKFCFYFPAKAVKSHMSLKESFHATTGYLIKILTAPFVASWRVLLGFIGYGIAGAVVIGLVIAALGQNPDDPPSAVALILAYLYYVPILVFFQPVMQALWIGILSNYYQHYQQNKSA